MFFFFKLEYTGKYWKKLLSFFYKTISYILTNIYLTCFIFFPDNFLVMAHYIFHHFWLRIFEQRYTTLDTDAELPIPSVRFYPERSRFAQVITVNFAFHDFYMYLICVRVMHFKRIALHTYITSLKKRDMHFSWRVNRRGKYVVFYLRLTYPKSGCVDIWIWQRKFSMTFGKILFLF